MLPQPTWLWLLELLWQELPLSNAPLQHIIVKVHAEPPLLIGSGLWVVPYYKLNLPTWILPVNRAHSPRDSNPENKLDPRISVTLDNSSFQEVINAVNQTHNCWHQKVALFTFLWFSCEHQLAQWWPPHKYLDLEGGIVHLLLEDLIRSVLLGKKKLILLNTNLFN